MARGNRPGSSHNTQMLYSRNVLSWESQEFFAPRCLAGDVLCSGNAAGAREFSAEGSSRRKRTCGRSLASDCGEIDCAGFRADGLSDSKPLCADNSGNQQEV